MEPLALKSVRLEFTKRAEITFDLEQRLLMAMNQRMRAEQDKAQRDKEKRETAEFHAQLQAVLAAPQRIADMATKLDRHDTATVRALMNNETDLVAVREKVGEMLLQAHTLPDGRRAFKTEDGSRIFDEFGQELGAETISSHDIADHKPRWEHFAAQRARELELIQERSDLVNYQEKLDASRADLGKADLTEKELAELEKSVDVQIPRAVMQELRTSGHGLADEIGEPGSPKNGNPAGYSARPTNLGFQPG